MNNEGENPLDSATEMKIKLESNELEESLVVENGLCYSTDEEQNLSTKKLWTVEEASNLIKAYREHPNLWDSKHVDHKNVIKKYDSLKVLSKKFGTNCNEIKRKIKNIKSQYQRERRTYEQLKKSGAGHQFKARWFGYAAMSFLHDNNAARKNNQVCFDFEDSCSSDSNMSASQTENEAITNQQTSEEPLEQSAEQLPPQPAEPIRTEKRRQDFSTPKTSFKRSKPLCSAKVSSKSVTDEDCQMIRPVFEKKQNEKSDRDEYDIFAELVGHKIRNLKTDFSRATVQHLINNLLYEGQIGKYDFPRQSSLIPEALSSPSYSTRSPSSEQSL